METNESNPKAQPTGGLKLMTVFIAVIALHVFIISGFAVYHLMSGSTTDADLLADKTHKGVKVNADGSVASDGQSTDASATAATTPAPDASATAGTTPPPDASATAATTPALDASAPTPPATTPTPTTTAMEQSTPVTASTPSGPVFTPGTSTPATGSAPIASEPAAPATLTPEPMTAADATPYVVKHGDTLARIARLHHTSVLKLKAANSLTSDVLRIGQKMVIPGATSTAATAMATTDTTSLVDSPSAPTTAPVAAAPAAPMITPKVATLNGHHLYTVVKGDTLTKIARKFKTTPKAIMTANSIADPAKLSIGKKLRIPSPESRSATNVAPAETTPAAQPAKAKVAGQLANYAQ